MKIILVGLLLLIHMIGFSVGDELGLEESLGNLDGNKRRSISNTDALIATNSVGTLPASKLPSTSPPAAEKQRAVQSFPYPYAQQRPGALMPSTTRAPIFYKRNTPQAMTEAQSLPLGVPAFRPLKTSATNNIQTLLKKASDSTVTRNGALHQYPAPDLTAANLTFIQTQLAHTNAAGPIKTKPMVISPQANAFKVPAFQALPSSVSRISTGQIVHTDNEIRKVSPATEQYTTIQRFDTINRKDDTIDVTNFKSSSTTPGTLPEIDLKGHTVEELAAVANVSVSAIKKAIELRQKQLMAVHEELIRNKTLEEELKRDEMIAKQLAMYQQEHQKFLATSTTEAPTTASTTTTTVRTTTARRATRAPVPQKISGKVPASVVQSKVMNAPKEYYPVGYDKNFDDNFTTKVDLPPTAFQCGDQKHFPGLYGDVDLGCMVFHVCALTDDGLIMKSFLCPESTLFDQTILKCNWWFYVDCKSSKSLYDSNLPVSKSYQLMKALTFFSNFKSKSGNDTEPAVDIGALQNSVLSKRNGKKLDPKKVESNKVTSKAPESTTNKPKSEPKKPEAKKEEKPTQS
ncbi:uncharacterized protein LOC129568231 isoform X2 [Sitodiplosis mosellana]|uniref:uncharacterized protein LOC129568231 isoform X2 n=1 Tax=Sitodiplosis mosellana TaxID=263140 RepID=UPI00244472C1|nr:uncharacterized protein LOC129568231 isoform X2 [Sitodiplosis mosellana]